MKVRQSVVWLLIEQLRRHPANVREQVGDVEDLARSIAEHGILQPLVATEDPDEHGALRILAGHRRLAAACRAGMLNVPVLIRHGLSEDPVEQVVVMLVENCQRRDLNPVEKAEAFGALRNRGLTQAEIARRTGVSQANVSYYLTLLELPEAERNALRQGSGTTAADAIPRVRLQREEERRSTREPNAGQIGRPRGRRTTPYFSDNHPLATTVRAACDHRGKPKVGGVGCGQCWETAIREDAVGGAA